MIIKTTNLGFDYEHIYVPYSMEYGFIPYCVDKELSTMELYFSNNQECKVKIGSYVFNYSDLFFNEQECQLACDKLNGINHD